ncbi:hypothetical protein GCM10027567_05890 [Spongiibacter taiwanensis]
MKVFRKAALCGKAGCLSNNVNAAERFQEKPRRAGLWGALDGVATLTKDNQP